MAALRSREVKIVSSQKQKRGEIKVRTAKRKMKKHSGPLKSSHHTRKFIEVVATSEAEANSGLFKQVGDLYVFKPLQSESVLWERIRNMSDPSDYEVWSLPGIGIRAALNKMNVDYPRSYNSDPAALLNYTTRTSGGMEASAAESYSLRPYEDIVRNKWLPSFVYQTKFGADGLFGNTKIAQAVATLFGITVDKYARGASWYRSPLPDIVSDVMRSNQIDESAYQHWKQTLLSTAEVSAEAGRAPEINWTIVERAIRDEAGPHTQSVMSRLHTELDAELERLKQLAHTKRREYTENRSRRSRKRA